MLQRTDSGTASMFHNIPFYSMYPLHTHLFPSPRGLLDFILTRISRHRLRLLRTRFEGRWEWCKDKEKKRTSFPLHRRGIWGETVLW